MRQGVYHLRHRLGSCSPLGHARLALFWRGGSVVDLGEAIPVGKAALWSERLAGGAGLVLDSVLVLGLLLLGRFSSLP